MEGALVCRPLTGDRNCHAGVALALEGERLTECWRKTLGDDSGAGEVRARVEEVHVPAAAVAEPGLTTEDLRGHRAQPDAVGDGQVVWPVGGGDRIFGSQVRTDPGGDWLLACRQMHFYGDEARADVEGWLLVGVVRGSDRLLVGPDQDHGAQEIPPRFVREGSCGGWRHRSSSWQVRRRCRTSSGPTVRRASRMRQRSSRTNRGHHGTSPPAPGLADS